MNNPQSDSLKKTILITGASTGIGFGAAGAFAKAGYFVIATVRSETDANRLVEQLGPRVQPILCDVTNAEQVAALPARIRELTGNEHLDGLINNAGIVAGPGPVEFQKMEDIRAQFEVNVFGLISVTMALLPLLGTKPNSKNQAGRIINISSVGGLIASPYIAAYAATKHAVEGLSHSLRRELRIFGIKVVIVGPGSIKSEIWNKSRSAATNPFKGTAYEHSFARFVQVCENIEKSGASPAEIGAFLVKVFEAPNPKARYAFVPGRFLNWTLPASLPHLWLDKLLAKMMALEKQPVEKIYAQA